MGYEIINTESCLSKTEEGMSALPERVILIIEPSERMVAMAIREMELIEAARSHGAALCIAHADSTQLAFDGADMLLSCKLPISQPLLLSYDEEDKKPCFQNTFPHKNRKKGKSGPRY